MKRYQHTKSGLFLMELLLNILLFCILCSCGLLLFVKSHNLTRDTKLLHQASRITSSIAAVYEGGDGTLATLAQEFKRPAIEGSICIYYDDNYEPCVREGAVYYVLAHLLTTDETGASTAGQHLQKLEICFYDTSDRMLYTITACHYTPSTPEENISASAAGREVTP